MPPCREKMTWTVRFGTADSAKNYTPKVHGDRFPSTLAVEHNCNETFISIAVMTGTANIVG